MADQQEKAAKPAKQKLSAEERRQRVREARDERVEAAFKGQKFEYVGEVTLTGSERYTDVTGNKGKHGHQLKNTKTGEVITVGPASLKKAAEVYGAVKLPEKPKAERKAPAKATEPAPA